jgi:hypothetical protein
MSQLWKSCGKQVRRPAFSVGVVTPGNMQEESPWRWRAARKLQSIRAQDAYRDIAVSQEPCELGLVEDVTLWKRCMHDRTCARSKPSHARRDFGVAISGLLQPCHKTDTPTHVHALPDEQTRLAPRSFVVAISPRFHPPWLQGLDEAISPTDHDCHLKTA